MTNRPRRSRQSRPRGKTIDLSAETSTTGASKAEGETATNPEKAETRQPQSPDKAFAAEDRAQAGSAETKSETRTETSAETPETEFAEDEGFTEAKAEPDASRQSSGANESTTEGTPMAETNKGAESSKEPPATEESSATAIPPNEGAEARSHSDWSKTGGYQGPPAVTRVPEKPKSAAEDKPKATAAGTGATAAGTSAARSAQASSHERSGVGFGGVLAAGIVGAAVALGGAYALSANGFFAPSAATSGASSEELASLRSELDTLRQNLDAAPQGADVAGAGVVTPEELAALSQRVEGLEAGSSGNSDTAAAIKAASESAAAARGRADEASSQIQTLQQSVDEAQQAANRANEAATSAREAARTATQSSRGASETAQQAAAGVEELKSNLETSDQRLSALERSNAEARLALAAAGLKSAIDSGSSFGGELDTFAKAGGSEATVEALRPYADGGVPTKTALAARWPDVEDRVAAALAGPGTDAPVGEQVLAGLQTLVRVRPAGPVDENAEGTEATVTRLDNAIETGDLAAFMNEWQSLPADAQKAGSDFAADVKARLATDQALSEAVSSLLNSSSAAEPAGQENQG
ncbi:inner membrane protein [Fulvimarina manganoxydans]|uniref:Inner membrane protein n=1 Tax=Fulvimarina manganoxydans TaxID=937218 RepID=A0A1W2EFS2_9HYPH|nr:mitofilin family membrane protein [Fulvimarina manganoxydans]SMD08614.1 inner membrane protein [Fulvimarina manganoxydans]